MSFWDAGDGFSFEKTFSIANSCPDYQSNIWYIEFLNQWITTDKTNALNGWDLENETKTYSLTSPKIRSSIIDIVPIEVLRLVAVSSLDKIITIWNISKRMCLTHLNLTQGGIHSMVFSNTYQVLITAGYENTVKIWSINPRFLDHSLIGRLVGHPSMVTAIEVVEKSPMAISADDSGNIKVWDLRNLTCLQTIELGNRVVINKVINLYGHNKLCFIGSRVNILDFDDLHEKRADDLLWPIKVEYNFNRNEIVLCTVKDVRFLDAFTGRVKKVYVGLLTDEDEESDITTLKLVQQNKKFIVGDHRGNLGLYLYATGELLKNLVPHTNEITNIKTDFANKLIITASSDSTLYIQRETKTGFEVKRKIKNIHNQKEITLLEVSVYHNLIATATTGSNVVYLYDYEFARLIGSVLVPKGTEPTCIHFINGYGFIIIADSSGSIHFIHVTKKDVSNITFQTVGRIEEEKNFEISKKDSHFVNRIAVEMDFDEANHRINNCAMYVATNQGYVRGYNLAKLFNFDFVTLVEHVNKRSNYNSDRNADEDFMSALNNLKLTNFDVSDERNAPLVFLTEDLVVEFKAHKDSITSLNVMISPDKKLMTSSLDCYLKIWTLKGHLLGSLNINHPLPILWDFHDDNIKQYRKKILYAMKIIDNVFRRYSQSMVYSEESNISINRFLKSLNENKAEAIRDSSKDNNEGENTTPRNKRKVLLMRNEYDPRDLQYEAIKDIYQKELQGPSLKQMEISKRLILAQKMWKLGPKDDEDKYIQESTERERALEDQKERNELMTFLLSDTKVQVPKEVNYSKKTKALSQKLEGALNKNSKKSKQKESISRNLGSIDSDRSEGYSPLLLNSNHTSKVNASDSPRIFNTNGDKKIIDVVKTSHFKQSTPVMYSDTSQSCAKLKQNINFFEYAGQRLLTSDNSQVSFLSGKSSSAQLTNFSGQYPENSNDRKAEQKDFKKILKIMNDNLKKSQVSSPTFSYIRNKQLRFDNSSSMQKDKTVTLPDTEKSSDNLLIPSVRSPEPRLNRAFDLKTEFDQKIDITRPSYDTTLQPRHSSLSGVSSPKKENFVEELDKLKRMYEKEWGLDKPSEERVQSYSGMISKFDRLSDSARESQQREYNQKAQYAGLDSLFISAAESALARKSSAFDVFESNLLLSGNSNPTSLNRLGSVPKNI